jgi:NHL repeat
VIRPLRATAAALALGSATLLVFAASALALNAHVFSTSFGSSGSGDGQVSSPQGVAVNSTSHDLYVADTANARVDQFSSSGAFIRAFGADVGGSGVNVCTTGCAAGTPGSGPGAFTTPTFVAVDNSGGSSQGDVYVGDTTNNVVTKFDASGSLITTWGTGGQLDGSTATTPIAGPFGSLAGVTVDDSGALWVYDTGGNMFAFAEDGSFTTDWNSGRGVIPSGIDADSAGNLYVLTGAGTVEQFSSTGTDVGPVNGDVSNPTGFAIDRSTSDVYMDSGGTLIYHYPSPCDAGGSCTAADTFGSGDLSSAAGLAVDSSSGTVYAADAGDQRIDVFTALTLPDVITGQSSSVTTTSATLNGTVNPDGTTITDCHFDYVDDADYNPSATNPYGAGATVPCSTTPSGSSLVPVSADVAGLQPNTTYHFRLVAANSSGPSDGTDQTLTTGGPPTVDGESAAAVTNGLSASADRESLSAQINPHGLDTTYHFEYGTADCASSACTSVPVPDADIGSQTTDQTVTQTITGLTAGTIYHYRVVATNSAAPPVAGPDQTFTINGFGFQPGAAGFDASITNQDGSPDTQAGSHPDALTINLAFNTAHDANGTLYPAGGNVRNIDVNLPPGLIGDPNATPQCPRATFENPNTETPCPADTQIGTSSVILGATGANGTPLTFPVYNLVPPPGVPAEFAFEELGINTFLDAGVRTGGDYGITEHITNINDRAIVSVSTTIEGVPGGAGTRPLLTLPTSCGTPLSFSAHADTWQSASVTADTSTVTSAITGCDKLDFSPSITARPDVSSADSSSGLAFDLHLDQAGLQDPNGLAAADLKRAVVTLPPGLTLNPSAADGLTGCTPAQIGLDNASEPTCPDASKVATVDITTPLLSDHLTGSVYLATPHDNPFDALAAGYIVAEADGVLIKLPGKFDLDPQTGQITASFNNNPQLPFSDLKLDFFGGPRGDLATPQTCGTYQTSSQLTPWSDPNTTTPATPGDSFTISSGPGGGPCPDLTDPARFTPGFQAGTLSPAAGQYSPFVLKVTRPDGQQNLKKIAVTLPLGLTAKLAGIPKCPQSQIAPGVGGSTNCDPASQVGSVNVGAGAGSSPFFLKQQPVYLTEGYGGAPFGLAIDTHALAGPFDLGHVVIRSKLNVDPQTAQVSADAEQLPDIIQGIPLRIRSVTLTMDHPAFTLNPTNCNPQTVTGQITGGGADFASPSDDTVKQVSDHFQVAGCGGLGFSPRLSGTILNGRQGIHRSDHPNLQFNLHATPGDANLASVAVLLPQSFQIDQANLGNICSETELAQTQCAGRNTVGTASATTPLLDSTLSGPVYAVSGSGGLPKLAVILNGPPADPLHLLVRGITDTVGAQIRNTFPLVPDAPITDFNLTLNGGPGGYLVNNTDVCSGAKGKSKKARKKASRLRRTNLTAAALFTAQDGDTLSQKVPIAAACGKAKHRHAKHKKK